MARHIYSEALWQTKCNGFGGTDTLVLFHLTLNNNCIERFAKFYDCEVI